jgi:hypothetical protein
MLAAGSCWGYFISHQNDLEPREEPAARTEITNDGFKATDIKQWSNSGGYQYKMELSFNDGDCQLPATADVVMGDDFIPKDVRNYSLLYVKASDGSPYVFQDQQALLGEFGPNPCVTLGMNDNPASVTPR